MTAKDVYNEIGRAYIGGLNKANGSYGISFSEYEVIKTERDEMLERLIHTSRTVCGSCTWNRGCCFVNKCPGLAKINVIIERATGMTIEEAIKAYEEDEK